ncbi:GNAT family N-acetyltransferase [Thalassospira sp. MA62]|nr:GNAT family N-acetyltransferase [Thalassospira sp. MA62]
MIDITHAKPQHRADWEQLWRRYIVQFGAPNMPDHVIDGLWSRIMDANHPMQAWLAVEHTPNTEHQTVIGFAHLIIHPHTFSLRNVAYLEDFWVSPDQRGNGIGSLVISALKDMAKKNDWARLYWHTTPDNHGAQRLYDRLAQRDSSVHYKIELN